MDARTSAENEGKWPRGLFAAVLCAASLLLGGCASTGLTESTPTASDPEAVSILTAAQRAQGSAAFATIRDLNVRYNSRWNTLGPRSHAALWDKRYRRESEEAHDLGTATVVQLHKGAGGRKFVLRAPGRVTVWYNGQPDSREEVLRLGALMADIEKLELLGPIYFQRPGVILEKRDPARVEGTECDRIVANLRPGFGFAEQDRVALIIERETQRLRRAILTLDGLKGGGKARLEIDFHKWAQRSGVWWPTEIDERMQGMMSLNARHAILMDLKANHGFAPRHPELVGEAVGVAAGQLR